MHFSYVPELYITRILVRPLFEAVEVLKSAHEPGLYGLFGTQLAPTVAHEPLRGRYHLCELSI
jgi:hypothetical protein